LDAVFLGHIAAGDGTVEDEGCAVVVADVGIRVFPLCEISSDLVPK